MGDTPSLLYLLKGDPEDPTAEHWGGSYVTDGKHADASKNYFTDNMNPSLKSGKYFGAKTVNKWRREYLEDWRKRMDRLQKPSSGPVTIVHRKASEP